LAQKKRKLIIVGDGETAQIAHQYFTHDSKFEVAAFSVEKQFLKRKQLEGLPVVPFETLEKRYRPRDYAAFVAVSYTQLNRVRTRLYAEVKRKGFSTPSYVSSDAFVWKTAKIGENCFIFEGNVIQHGAQVANNVVIWSGNHIGHQTHIGANCYIASHVVISGFCEIGENCFLGVSSCLSDRVKVAKDCIIGAGAVVLKDTEPGKVYVGNPARPLDKSSFEAFAVKEVRQ
jgi:sugar O-acyltransferase (sialic acid O-acetyltransferase NeuD family)